MIDAFKAFVYPWKSRRFFLYNAEELCASVAPCVNVFDGSPPGSTQTVWCITVVWIFLPLFHMVSTRPSEKVRCAQFQLLLRTADQSASCVPSLPADLVWASHRGERSRLRGWICISWTCSRSWRYLELWFSVSRGIFRAELVLMKH